MIAGMLVCCCVDSRI